MVPFKEVLKSHFGDDFPVGAGECKRDNPLVITDPRSYVAIEYAVAKFILDGMGFEHKFEQQRTHHYDGRVVDELAYAAKEPGEPEWTQTRRFFFDVTAGFNKGRPQETESSGHSDRFREFLSSWHSLSKSNTEIYRKILKEDPPATLASVSHPVVLYKIIYGRLGIRLTDKDEKELREIYLQHDGSANSHSATFPSIGALRFLLALPNVLLVVAVASVTFAGFSWIVIGAALFAKLWNSFARYLAGGGHPSAGLHTTIAMLSLPTTLAVSLLHAFRVVQFL